jgi:hypothetical protein
MAHVKLCPALRLEATKDVAPALAKDREPALT